MEAVGARDTVARVWHARIGVLFMINSNERDYFGEASGVNSLTWAETKRAYNEGQIVFYVDRGLALTVAAYGLKTGLFGSIVGLAMPVAFLAGLVLAFLSAWWWFLVGVVLTLTCYRVSRQAAVTAVRKAALLDERLFYLFREKKIIWFESRA